MTSNIESVAIDRTEKVVVSGDVLESVAITQTERVVIATDTGKVIVTGMLGPKVAASIGTAYDVDLSNLNDGSTLIYSVIDSKWKASNLFEKQVMEGGQY